MEGIGETLQNVGLAQEIQNGLGKNLQKEPQWASPPEVEAMKAELKAKGLSGMMDMRLAKHIAREWSQATGNNLGLGNLRMSSASYEDDAADGATNFTEFAGSGAFDLLAKYAALGKKLGSAKVEHSQFFEARALGRGAFGAVFLVFKKDTGYPMATKKMVKTIAKKNKMLKDCLIEREVLAKIRSPFCVNLHYAYDDKTNIYLTLTLCPGGDLTFLIKSRYHEKGPDKGKYKGFDTQGLKFYIGAMALGLQAIHDAGYVYRDLKPQNVLLDAEGKVRISDMGLTADVSKGAIKQKSGTCGYWSPETIKKESYTFEPDWWSLGVTAYVLFSDKMPFKGKTDEEKNEATKAGEIEFSHGEPADLQGFISALCTVDTSKRLSSKDGVSEVQSHPYFEGFDWTALEEGLMAPPIIPNPNDINAPSSKEIEAFKAPEGVTWDAADQEQFNSWEMMDTELWGDEAIARMKKRKELNKILGTKAIEATSQVKASPMISAAKAARESKKGEDFAALLLEGENPPAAFAIFDGHSGKEAARFCSELVCQRLLAMAKKAPITKQQIIDTLWAVDEEIGIKPCRDGCTSQIMIVEKAGDTLKGTIAWTGDSSLVIGSMTDGKVLFSTASHTAGPDHQGGGAWQEEKGVLEGYGAVRKALEAKGLDTQKDDISAEQVEEAIKACGQTADPEYIEVCRRAMKRAKIIAKTFPEGSNYRKNVFVRQRDKDHDVNQVWVVSTAEKRADPGYSDLQMTRSICDWRASDLVLPHPQIHTFEVPANEAYRVCVASDGLWDICSFAKAATTMKNAPNVEKAAKTLLGFAEKEYIQNRGHEKMDDDTTILVVELNPSGIKVGGGDAGGGCCSVM